MGQFQSLLSGYQHTTSVVLVYQQSSSKVIKLESTMVALSSINSQASDKWAQINGRNQNQQPEPTRMPGEVLCCVSLNEVKFNEDLRPRKHYTAIRVSTLSLSVGFYLYSLQTSRILLQVCFRKTSHETASAKHLMCLYHII